MESDGFKLINRKKSSKSNKVTNNLLRLKANAPFDLVDVQKTIRRIQSAQEEFLSSNVYLSFKALITESLSTLNNPKIEKIICLGLGAIGESIISRYQLAFLLYLQERFGVDVHVYDPIFTNFDKEILKQFQCEVLNKNLGGKYLVKNDEAVVFYLPHCPQHLSNDVLWKNWGLRLSNCIIIANSFLQVIERKTRRSISVSAKYISQILPYTTEFAVVNEFKFHDVFNDTSIHVFPVDNLKMLPVDFWENCPEPEYSDDDEIIAKQLSDSLVL